MIDWTHNPNLDARLEILWSEGFSTRKIAEILAAEYRLNFTKNSIVGRVHRLKLQPRSNPIARVTQPPILGPLTLEQWQRKHRSRSIPTPSLVTLPVLKSLEPSKSAGPPGPAPKPAPTWTLQPSRPCCWPLGEPKQPGFRYCDAPSIAGKSYCPEHHKVAYLRPSEVPKYLRYPDTRPKAYVGPRAVTVR